MEQNKIYRGGMTNEQFLFFEMRTTASLLCSENDENKIFETIVSENLYQFPTERNFKRAFNTCIRRLKLLQSETLVELIATASVEVAKQINLYAMMLDNGIVCDFLIQVIGEKYRNQDLCFSKKDVNDFLFELQEKLSDTKTWTDNTVAKIRQVLVKSIVECGYLDSPRSNKLNYVYLYPELENELRGKGLVEFLPAFNALE